MVKRDLLSNGLAESVANHPPGLSSPSLSRLMVNGALTAHLQELELALNTHGDTHATADAQSCQPLFRIAALHFMQQCDKNTGT